MSLLKRYSTLSRKQRGLRVLFSMLVVMVMSMSLALTAFATSSSAFSVKSLYQLQAFKDANACYSTGGKNEQYKAIADLGAKANSPISWSDIASMAAVSNDNLPDADLHKEAYKFYLTARAVYATFESSSAYGKATAALAGIAEYDPASDSLIAIPGKETALANAQSSFNAAVASSAASSTFTSIFDMASWNPQSGPAATLLSKIYSVVNTVFYVCSNLVLWFFLVQTGFDVLYLVFEPLRPFIGPRESSGGGGLGMVNAGGEGILSKIKVPIASQAAAQAANGDSGGGLGGNGNAMGGNNIFIAYAIKRFPIIILCATYLILVSNGYWIKVIGWVSGLVIKVIDFFLQLGQ